jgi:hypothetical protein
MPYLHRVTRATISGTSYGGAEIWSTGFYIGNVAADATMPTQAQADQIRDAWRTFFTNSTSKFSNSWQSTLVKVSSIGTDGKSNVADTVFSDFSPAAVGATPERMPPQVSLVASLQGVSPRGVASKGRMYLPGIAAALGSDGKISSVDQGNIATNFQTFLQAVNAFAGTPNVVMLASEGSLNRDGTPRVGGSGPKNSQVINVRVGNVYDTQRRRRNGLAEVYISKVL